MEYQDGDLYIGYLDHILESPEVMEHYHASFEIALFIKADIRIFIKDKQYDIRDGDLLFINELEIHRMIYTPHTHYARYVINFRRNFIADVLKQLHVYDILTRTAEYGGKKFTPTKKQFSELEALVKSLANHSRSPSGSSKAQAAHLKLDLIRLLLEMSELPHAKETDIPSGKSEDLVRRIIGFIDTHYMEDLSLELLEREFYVNRFHISRVFSKMTGFSVVEYIQNRRVLEAQKKLKGSSANILSICHDCGFNNIQHFCRVFRKITGSTPNKFRKSSW